MAAVNEIPPNGWPLLPPDPESTVEPVAVVTTEPEIPVDDLAALMASLNTPTERVYLDRRG